MRMVSVRTASVSALFAAIVTAGVAGFYYPLPAHADLTDYSIVYTTWCSSGCDHTRTFTASQSTDAYADCPSGEVAVGGGVASSTADSGLGMYASYPENSGNRWEIGLDPVTTQGTITVAVTCATVNNN